MSFDIGCRANNPSLYNVLCCRTFTVALELDEFCQICLKNVRMFRTFGICMKEDSLGSTYATFDGMRICSYRFR